MRYYSIDVTPVGGSKPSVIYQSHPQGQFNPAALDIEFDAPVTMAGLVSAVGGQTVTIHGISLEDISQAQDFVGQNLVMRGGMQAGLPLNNPAQAGVVVQGNVFQTYGNWIGTDMTLDFVLLASTFTLENPGNLVLNWQAGTSLVDALKTTLSTAYPDTPLHIHIGSNYVPPVQRVQAATTLDDLATFVSNITTSHFKSEVHIVHQNGAIRVFDATYQPKPVQLAFTDLIGQPTWIAPGMLQAKTVMRADLQLGSFVTMPQGMQSVPGFVTTTAAALPSSLKFKTTFQGTFQVSAMRHLGHFRSTDAGDWATIFNLVPTSTHGT